MLPVIIFILILFCIYLAVFQYRNNNKTIMGYWIVVGLYWTVNLLQDLLK
jgi:hypothetical protein